ncbi:DNA alkylation repair protein [Anaerorhabdus sp.]|uniref:DNA alkylation repair protein n=1 Tax=Anaerorhabdus sp. TaxID=1872524 RepID=UPI002FCA64D6
MPDLLKDVYNHQLLYRLACDIQSIYVPFKIEDFLKTIMNETWDTLELKDRYYQIAVNLKKYLPENYIEALDVLNKVVTNYGNSMNGLCFFFPAFVELYGQDEMYFAVSMEALATYTEYASAEFAVRPFLVNDEERMIKQMIAWSMHDNEHVRRLSSEGCRPALPWAFALSSFKKDPTPILPILEQLKDDPSLYVRKSVANNLNDISKTHPELVLKLARDWYGKSENINWVVKHGCRTLLKNGNQKALAIFGYNDVSSINIQNFTLSESSISIGNEILISFTISSLTTTKVRLEYAIDFVKSSGKRNRKIFKISEILLPEKMEKVYRKKHSFTDMSVRKHYPGIHSITLIVNGREYGTLNFNLKDGIGERKCH